MTGMTISAQKEAAREAARHSGGQFGEQTHTAPTMNLGYVYPALRQGFTPDQIDINVWQHGGVARIRAYPDFVSNGGEWDFDPDDGIFRRFEVPLTAEHAAELDEDHWTRLDQAPTWLQDAVMPSLIGDDNHPDTAAWRKARHDRIIAAGGFASTYDNAYMVDFEDLYPTSTPLDAAAALFDMEEAAPGEDPSEREMAAAEISRRAAAGMGGVLEDARNLRAGDRISVAHLAEHLHASWDTTEHEQVTRVDEWEGSVQIHLTYGRILGLPAGARVPALGFDIDGQEMTATAAVAELRRRGELAPAAHGMDPFDVLHQYHQANGLDQQTLTPSTTGAAL